MKSGTRTALVLTSLTLAACGDGRYMRVGLEPLSSLGIPAFQVVGDSTRLYAAEWKHQLIGAPEPSIPTSDQAPDRYHWSSDNPKVADVTSTGWMLTHGPGQVVITVRGPGSSYSQSVAVCARDTRLRIEPHDPVIKLHDTITVRVFLTQLDGGDCGSIDFGPFAPQQGSGTAGLEPIFSLPNHWRAIRPGTYWYTSSFHFAHLTLRDSTLVVIQ